MKIQVTDRDWDAFDGYLFDIDGTLLNCTDAVHYFAFCEALKMLSGRSLNLEGVTAHGNTDVGILRDALLLAEIPESDWRPNIPAACEQMGAYVAARQAELWAPALPYVEVLLEHLKKRGAKLGVATGNLKRIGELKLMHAGLLSYFEVGGWSDNFERRSDVFRSAATLVRAATKNDAAICVLGDTPADVEAAHQNNLPIIAVATGVYSAEELRRANPECCIESFRSLFDPDQESFVIPE